ncbi:MAG TPA: acyl carrier protein [Chthoniobacterales bacterium]
MPSSNVPQLGSLEAQLLALIQERLLETPPDFDVDTNLYDSGLDSMAIMQLLLLLEENFGVVLIDADLTRKNFSDIRHLARLVQARMPAS